MSFVGSIQGFINETKFVGPIVVLVDFGGSHEAKPLASWGLGLALSLQLSQTRS